MRYPLFKPGDSAMVVNSTLDSSSATRNLAESRATVRILERHRQRQGYVENNGKPYYVVDFQGWSYIFSADDLERV